MSVDKIRHSHTYCARCAEAERDEWKARAERAEAKARAVEAECDRLADYAGGWYREIAELFRGVLRSADEDVQT